MISLKEQLRKSLLEVCPPEDLCQWFDPLQLRLESDAPEKGEGTSNESVYSKSDGENEHNNGQGDDENGRAEKEPAETGIAEPVRYTLVVSLPHSLFAEWFARKGQDVFESTVALLSTRGSENDDNDRPLSIRYEAPQDAPLREIEKKGQTGLLTDQRGRKETLKNQSTQPQQRFEDYIANAKHKQTLHVLRDLLPRNPRAVCPVVLCGPTGSGKTHLFVATAARLTQTLGSGMVLHSAEKLDSQCLSEEMRSLLVDNMHRFPTELAVQGTFIRRLDNTLHEGYPVLLAGLGRPGEWPLTEELRSRLHSGLVLSLPEADMDMCLRFAQQRFKSAGLKVEKEALLQLVRRFPDMRRLTGVLRRMEALYTPGQDIDLEQVMAQSDAPGLTPQAIIHLSAEALDVNPKEIFGSKRKPKLVRARQLAMFLCRELLGHSYPIIGQHFGGKDHSSVIHAVRKMKELQASDADTNILVTEVTKRCKKLAE